MCTQRERGDLLEALAHIRRIKDWLMLSEHNSPWQHPGLGQSLRGEHYRAPRCCPGVQLGLLSCWAAALTPWRETRFPERLLEKGEGNGDGKAGVKIPQ